MTSLRRFLLAETAKPLPDDTRMQSADGVIRDRYWAPGSTDEDKAEIRTEVVRILVQAAHQNVWADPWRMRVRHLATVADELEILEAKTPLLFLAQKNLQDDLMEWVLYGLAGVQRGPALWPFWWSRWICAPQLRPVVSLGLRLADPVRTLGELPRMIFDVQQEPWLGELLWGFATDKRSAAGFREAIPADLRVLCQGALEKLGASPEELLEFLGPEPMRGHDP